MLLDNGGPPARGLVGRQLRSLNIFFRIVFNIDPDLSHPIISSISLSCCIESPPATPQNTQHSISIIETSATHPPASHSLIPPLPLLHSLNSSPKTN